MGVAQWLLLGTGLTGLAGWVSIRWGYDWVSPLFEVFADILLFSWLDD